MIETLAGVIFVLIVIVILLCKKNHDLLIKPKCEHVWKTDKVTDIYDTSFGFKEYSHTNVQSYCTKCGVWKKFEV